MPGNIICTMYYKNLKSFFESVIGYNGSSWESDLDKENSPWLSHDMEKMLRNHVGYPSLLHLLVVIPFLGYCAGQKNKECKDAGDLEDFKYFCNKYLTYVNEEYVWEQKGERLWKTVRNKLAHVYFAKHAITTDKHLDHLKIKKEDNDHYYLFISVRSLWEDTKKAIELLHKDISEDFERETLFLKKLDLLDQWQWKLNKGDLASKFPMKSMGGRLSNSGPSGPNMPVSGEKGPKLIG